MVSTGCCEAPVIKCLVRLEPIYLSVVPSIQHRAHNWAELAQRMPLSVGILSCLGHMFTREKNKALPFPHMPQKGWVFWYDLSRIIWIGWISHTSFLIVSQLSSCYFLVFELFGNRSHVSQAGLELLCIQGWPWTSGPPALSPTCWLMLLGPGY